MNLEIKNVLEKIESHGFEAYVVGGYVRDYLLGIESVDVDICTNALPKDVLSIFNIKKETASYGSVNISSGKYNFDITTYRKESNYLDRKPQSIEYTSNLLFDINRRDFTINTLCMNSDGKIFDYLDGKKDLKKRLIKVVGNTEEKLTEDPLRILRALRFAIILNFHLDKKIIEFIKNHKDLISTLSYTRKKEELDKILSSKNAIKGLEIFKKLDLLSELDIRYDKITYVNDLLGMWSQIDFSPKYPFTKSNLENIEKIRKILNNKKINNEILFNNDLYVSTVAGIIMGYSPQKTNKLYLNLPIKSKKDIDISSKDIMNIIGDKTKISLVEKDLINQILNRKIQNKKSNIKDYITSKWK